MTEVTHATATTTTPPLQPLLHDLASCVAAPGVLLSGSDGQLDPGGAAGVGGWYVGDVRLLDRWRLSVAGSDLDLVRADTRGAATHSFSHVARSLGGHPTDPTVRLDRTRTLWPDALEEEVVVGSDAGAVVDVVVRLDLGSDLGAMATVKQGGSGGPVPPNAVADGLVWSDGRVAVRVTADPAPVADASTGRLEWRLRLEPGGRRTLRIRAGTDQRAPFGPGRPAPWAAQVEASDLRVRRVVEQGLTDLAGLLLTDGEDRFLAAGSPWFLTLFGRDSLWAARMLVPFDAGLTLSTLRTLARRQGVREDPTTEEQPGKILHEVRPGPLDLGAQVLPPLYYGSVDATALFVCALADAHHWGADPDAVRALLPATRRCLEWVMAQSAESGWLRYRDRTGTGLANQGWKDSHDSVSFADGRLAEPPIALAEVQGYAFEAAARGAELLSAYGEEPVAGLTDWAADLRARFGEDFWVDTPEGGHAAIGLDGEGARVDSLTSNIGHLLGTGLLDGPRIDRIAALLADPRLDSGFGVRTLASDSRRFSMLSYHGGTVWPHDTAIAARGLAEEGRLEEAARLTLGLVVAAEGFGYRLPELYGGDSGGDVALPSAYPAACRPQAWAAAAPLAALVAVTGIRVDAAAGEVRHPARTSALLGAFTLRGLRLGAEPFDVVVADDGAVTVELPAGSPLRVIAPR